MSIRKKGSLWVVDLRPNGVKGRRVIRKFETQREARSFESWLKGEAHSKPWEPKKADSRTLKDLAELWFQAKGIHLKDGEKRLARVNDVAESLGNPRAEDLSPKDWTLYAATRRASGIAPKTLNNELGYVNSVFNFLGKTGEISYQNPFKNAEMIKLDERELSWLSLDEIKDLLAALESAENPHVSLLTRICLATGARWGEAEKITPRMVRAGQIRFSQTKSGKSRSVPISEKLETEIVEHLKIHGHFTSSITAFRRALKRSKIELPRGQAAHALRHSFASHFMMNGGNILSLQKILGHSSIVMTMRYAHLAPDHLKEAIKLNPLAHTN